MSACGSTIINSSDYTVFSIPEEGYDAKAAFSNKVTQPALNPQILCFNLVKEIADIYFDIKESTKSGFSVYRVRINNTEVYFPGGLTKPTLFKLENTRTLLVSLIEEGKIVFIKETKATKDSDVFEGYIDLTFLFQANVSIPQKCYRFTYFKPKNIGIQLSQNKIDILKKEVNKFSLLISGFNSQGVVAFGFENGEKEDNQVQQDCVIYWARPDDEKMMEIARVATHRLSVQGIMSNVYDFSHLRVQYTLSAERKFTSLNVNWEDAAILECYLPKFA